MEMLTVPGSNPWRPVLRIAQKWMKLSWCSECRKCLYNQIENVAIDIRYWLAAFKFDNWFWYAITLSYIVKLCWRSNVYIHCQFDEKNEPKIHLICVRRRIILYLYFFHSISMFTHEKLTQKKRKIRIQSEWQWHKIVKTLELIPKCGE